MNFFLKQPPFKLQLSSYLVMLTLIAPLINFLSGISVDLYAPSMPEIVTYFHSLSVVVKNTITAMMIGLGVGALVFGMLFDMFGRRITLLGAIALYFVASCVAPFSTSINQLIIIRFIQGVATGAVAIGSRALVIDNFTGHRFFVVIVYTSVAYGLGPVLGPFIGGYLQYHFNWQANFYVYAFFSACVFVMVFLFVHESLAFEKRKTALQAILSYRIVLLHPTFFLGLAVMVFVMIEQLLYPTIGTFIVQNQLGFSPIVYGNTALLVGMSYLVGSILNRFLVVRIDIKKLILFGSGLLVLFVVSQFILSVTIGLTLWTLFVPLMIMGFALGFVHANTFSLCLKLFPEHAGVAAAVQASFLMLFSSIGIFVISHFTINHLIIFAIICLVLVVCQLGFLVAFLRKPSN